MASVRLLFEKRAWRAVTSLSKAELVDLVGPSTIRITGRWHPSSPPTYSASSTNTARDPITDDRRAALESGQAITEGFLLRTLPSYAVWVVAVGIPDPTPAEVKAEPAVWMARAGRGAVYAAQFDARSVVVGGWGEAGDVSGLSREEIADRAAPAGTAG